VFTSQERERLRGQLLGLAGDDPRIAAAAVTGSAAEGLQDRWSDIDLSLGVAEDVQLETVLADWTDCLYGEPAALHHFDLKVPTATYRAFLLPSCLEIDLGFTPASQFGPRGPRFCGVFGQVVQPPGPTRPIPGT
jgi:Nucleotidyltransferase domain